MAVYDRIGVSYSATRRADPRIAAQIRAAAGADAASVVNVGAGAGAYEPPGTVLALDPSPVMTGQRPPGAAPAVLAAAEALPLRDDAADVVMALLTVHHWQDVAAGLAELRRVARRRIVVLTWDQEVFRRFWLLREYLPGAAAFEDARAVPLDRMASLLGGASIEPVLIPHDCADGFDAAFWRRPQAYLDPAIRAGMSMFAQSDGEVLRAGLERLAADITSGQWHQDHTDLLDLREFDAGYRLLIQNH